MVAHAPMWWMTVRRTSRVSGRSMNQDKAKQTNHKEAVATNRQVDPWAAIQERICEMMSRPDGQLILRERDSVVVIFLGEPWAYEAAWHDEKRTWVPANMSPAPVEPALRIRINVYSIDTRKLMWWEMDVHTFRDLCDTRDNFGLTLWKYKITAESVSDDGSCGEYSIMRDGQQSPRDRVRVSVLQPYKW